MQAKRPRNTKRSSASSSAGSKKAAKAKSEGIGNEEKALQLKQRAQARSVQCACCGEKDDAPDPLEPDQNRLWGYYKPCSKELMARLMLIIFTLISDGAVCWFCLRVWNSIYQSRMTLTVFKTWLGKSEDSFTEFNKCLHWLIAQMEEKIKKTGDRQISLKWPEPWKLSEQTIYRTRWVKPPAAYMELEVHKQHHGDYKQNGDVLEKGPSGMQLLMLRSK